MAAGRTGQYGTSAAVHVAEVKGQGRVNATIQHRRTEVACVMATHWKSIAVTLDRVRVSQNLSS